LIQLLILADQCQASELVNVCLYFTGRIGLNNLKNKEGFEDLSPSLLQQIEKRSEGIINDPMDLEQKRTKKRKLEMSEDELFIPPKR